MSIVHSQMHSYPLRKKKEAALLWQRTGLYKCTSDNQACTCLWHGLVDQHTPHVLSSSNRLPASAAMPCHYRGPSEKGMMLPSAVAGRTGRQDWQAGRLAGSPGSGCLPKPQTPADESQLLCCGNANTRSGSPGLMTICSQMMRIFKMFVLCLWAF